MGQESEETAIMMKKPPGAGQPPLMGQLSRADRRDDGRMPKRGRAALGPVAPLCRTAAGAALLHRNDLRGLHAQPDAGRHDAGRARE